MSDALVATLSIQRHANLDAERAALGLVLSHPEEVDAIDAEPEDFTHPGHRATWAAVRRLRAEGRAVDFVTVADELERAGKLEAVGGMAGFVEFTSAGWMPGHGMHYAELLRRASLTRAIHGALIDLAKATASEEGEELLARVHETFSRIDTRAKSEGGGDLDECVLQTVRAMYKRLDGKGPRGLATGLRDLDFLLGGLMPGVVTVLGGRTSMGKSSLARTIADNVSAAGHGVHVFSLEDSCEAYTLRVLSDQARIDLQALHSLRLNAGHLAALSAAAERVRRKNWMLDDSAHMTAQRIAIAVRKRRKRLNTKLVVVDYIQLMREAGREKRDRIDAAMLGLVRLAREDGLAVLVLSQVNRENDKEGRRPRLSDLKESGTIEEAADAVLLVHRSDEESGVVVGKNKHGPCGWVPLFWDGPTATYRDLDRRHADRGRHWQEEREWD